MSRAPLLPLLLGTLCLRAACVGSHSFRAYLSALSAPVPALPQFSVVAFVDDAPIGVYSSETREIKSRAAWMENERPEHWARSTALLRNQEPLLNASLKLVMDHLNHTRGLHTFQLIVGCELGDDGSTGGFFQYSYDGRDFISLHKDTLSWVVAMPAAQFMEQLWSKDRSIAERWKDYLEGECIEALQRYLRFGNETLQRRVRPETMVSHRKSGASNTLTCHAYEFYPREIEVKWFRNGVEMPAKFLPQTLPNPDGTYQIKTTVDVPEGEEEEEMFTCRVDHSSLDNALNMKYEKAAQIGLIIGAIAGVVILLAAAIGGIFIWRKRSAGQGGYAAANNGEMREFDKGESSVPLRS